jgi:hypothetical protein
MSKFLLNLLLQIPKVLAKSEIHSNSKINSIFKPSLEFGPTGPVLPVPAHSLSGRRLPSLFMPSTQASASRVALLSSLPLTCGPHMSALSSTRCPSPAAPPPFPVAFGHLRRPASSLEMSSQGINLPAINNVYAINCQSLPLPGAPPDPI